MTLQTKVSLYQDSYRKGQNYTGPGQAMNLISGTYATPDQTDVDLDGIAVYGGGTTKGDFYPFASASYPASSFIGFFVQDKMKQNPPANLGSSPTYKTGDRVTVMTTGQMVVQTVGTLTLNGSIYIYVGSANPENWGKLTNTSTAGDAILIGGTDYTPDGTNSIASPIRVIEAEDGLALVSISLAG